eukprot:c1529_g1_i1.p1 GENE.c1529_g1_i1~~c1529_g1_i1.p1  ORF type:complete len:100 (+),score=0.42 c1529_g1_i1:140-439(+)
MDPSSGELSACVPEISAQKTAVVEVIRVHDVSAASRGGIGNPTVLHSVSSWKGDYFPAVCIAHFRNAWLDQALETDHLCACGRSRWRYHCWASGRAAST